MKKWIFLCIPLLVILLTLSVLTNKPISQAASPPLVNNHDKLSFPDAPPSNAEYYIAMNDMAVKDEPLFDCKNSLSLKEKQFLTNSSTANEMDMLKNEIPPIVANGLLPEANYEYTYAPSFEGEAQKTYVASINPFVVNAVDLLEEEFKGYTYMESEDSFALGIAYSDIFFFSLRYPLKQQTATIDKDISYNSNNETEVMIESTSMTLTTKAGTFENVVVIRYPNGSKMYLAKGFGIIRITDFDGEITTELIARK